MTYTCEWNDSATTLVILNSYKEYCGSILINSGSFHNYPKYSLLFTQDCFRNFEYLSQLNIHKETYTSLVEAQRSAIKLFNKFIKSKKILNFI